MTYHQKYFLLLALLGFSASCRTAQNTAGLMVSEVPSEYADISPFLGHYWFDHGNCSIERFHRDPIADISFKSGAADGSNMDGLSLEYDSGRVPLYLGTFGRQYPRNEPIDYNAIKENWYPGVSTSPFPTKQETQILEHGFVFRTETEAVDGKYTGFKSEKWTKGSDGSIVIEISERYGRKPFKVSSCRLTPRDTNSTADEFGHHRDLFLGEFHIARSSCNMFGDHTNATISFYKYKSLDFFTLTASGGTSTGIETRGASIFLGQYGRFHYSETPLEIDRIPENAWSPYNDDESTQRGWFRGSKSAFTVTDSALRDTKLEHWDKLNQSQGALEFVGYYEYSSDSWVANGNGSITISRVGKYRTAPAVRKSCLLVR